MIPAMRLTILSFLFLSLMASGAPDAPKTEEKPSKEKTPAKIIEPVVKEASVMIGGKQVPYKVTTGKLQLKKDDGEVRASIFHVSYERADVGPQSTGRCFLHSTAARDHPRCGCTLACSDQKSSSSPAMARPRRIPPSASRTIH